MKVAANYVRPLINNPFIETYQAMMLYFINMTKITLHYFLISDSQCLNEITESSMTGKYSIYTLRYDG